MTNGGSDLYARVGPVLQAGSIGGAIVAAIRDLNEDVLVLDRGAYLRVLVLRRCSVSRVAIERRLGRPFRFPGELEMVMSAFKGALHITQDEASWQFIEAPGKDNGPVPPA